MNARLYDIIEFEDINSLNYQLSKIIKKKENGIDENMIYLYGKRSAQYPFHKYESYNGFYKSTVRIIDERFI